MIISSLVIGSVFTSRFVLILVRPDALRVSGTVIWVVLSLLLFIAHCVCSKQSARVSGLSFEVQTVPSALSNFACNGTKFDVAFLMSHNNVVVRILLFQVSFVRESYYCIIPTFAFCHLPL